MIKATSSYVYLAAVEDDRGAKQNLAAALRSAGIQVWSDDQISLSGEDWMERLGTAIGQCSLFIVMCSRRTVRITSDLFRRECALALERSKELGERTIFIIPVIIDDSPYGLIPLIFAHFQAVRLPQGEATQEFLLEVLGKVTMVLDEEKPWPGLLSYQENHSAFFHGRSAETEELIQRVRGKTLTILTGQSGLGKSSLLHAGLFPRLRAVGGLPIVVRFDFSRDSLPLVVQARRSLRSALQRSQIRAMLTEDQLPTDDESLLSYFHRADLPFADSFADYIESARRLEHVVPVLVFDQFEELFIRGREHPAARAWTDALIGDVASLAEHRPPGVAPVSALQRQPPHCRVLLSLREDYVAELDSLRPVLPSAAENRQRITRLDGRQALAAVVGPGHRVAGSLVTPGVARQIVRFIASGEATEGTGEDFPQLEVEPPLLSLVMSRLNDRRRSRGLSQIEPVLLGTAAGLSSEAALRDILREFYQESLMGLDPGVRGFVEEDLLTDSGFRDSLAVETAERKLRNRGVDPTVLRALIERRLLRFEERGRLRRVEIAHDVLCGVLREERERRLGNEDERRAEGFRQTVAQAKVPTVTDFRYYAFVGYAHQDNRGRGRRWADWIQQELEAYRVPKELVGHPNARGEPVPSRLYPIFSDEAELSATSDLASQLRAGLEKARYLIVICSPRAAVSRYLAEEIRYFKQLGRAAQIISVIVAGNPRASDMGDSSPQNGANECLPEPLRFEIKSDGTIDRSRRSEPLFIDLRPGQGFEEGFTTATDFRNALEKEGSFSRSEINQLVAEYANRLDKAKHKLAAALLQVSSDELEQRAYRHQLALARRRQRLLAAVVLCLCLLLAAAVGSSIYAFHLEVRAERAGREAEQSRALSMRLELEAKTEFARAKQAAAEAETAKQEVERLQAELKMLRETR